MHIGTMIKASEDLKKLKGKLDNNRKKNIMKNRKEKKMDKQKAFNFLYKDWLEYKKYYKDNMQFDMKESFIEYLEREVIELGMQEYIKIQQQKG